MHELRLLDPNGYLALHPQARTVVPAEETAAARHHLLTVVAPADAAAPYNQGAGYQPYAYRVQTTPLPEESRMAELNFHLFHPDEPGDADLDDGTCNCDKPDDRYVMEIEEGRVNLTHAACGKAPNWGDDWQEVVFASSMPVRVVHDSNCSGSHMHSHTFGCDCDYWFQITEVMGSAVGAEDEAKRDAAASSPEREAEYRTAEMLATKGPWGLYDDGTGRFDIAADLEDTGHGYRCRRGIAQLDTEPIDNDPAHKEWTAGEDAEQVRIDAEFIGLAREAVPMLLAALDAERAANERLRKRVAELADQRDDAIADLVLEDAAGVVVRPPHGS